VLRIARVATEARVYPLGRPLNVRYEARRGTRCGVFFCESAQLQSDFFIGSRGKSTLFMAIFSQWRESRIQISSRE